MSLDQKKFKGLGGIPLQTASDQKGVTLTLPAVQMMMSQVRHAYKFAQHKSQNNINVL
jgi:hypothetical protein